MSEQTYTNAIIQAQAQQLGAALKDAANWYAQYVVVNEQLQKAIKAKAKTTVKTKKSATQ